MPWSAPITRRPLSSAAPGARQLPPRQVRPDAVHLGTLRRVSKVCLTVHTNSLKAAISCLQGGQARLGQISRRQLLQRTGLLTMIV